VTRRSGDGATRGWGDAATRGWGDAATRGWGDGVTRGWGDAATRDGEMRRRGLIAFNFSGGKAAFLTAHIFDLLFQPLSASPLHPFPHPRRPRRLFPEPGRHSRV